MLKRSFLTGLIGLLCLGCGTFETTKSNQFSPNDIHQSYSVGANKDLTEVTAVFTNGESSTDGLELTEPAKIEFNGKRLVKMEGGMMKKSARYYDSLHEYPAKQIFTFTDAKGSQETYEITLNPLEITGKDLEVSLTKGGELPLSRPIESDETVEVFFDSTILPPPSNSESNANEANAPKPRYAWTFQAKLNAERTKAVIEPASLERFVAGKTKVRATVIKTKTLENSAKGVSIKSQYRSENIMVNVKN